MFLEGTFWMKDLFCDGSEKRLSNCRFDHWDNTECDQSEVAGVICSNKTSFVGVSKKPTVSSKFERSVMKLRLNGGRTKMEGRIEVRNKNLT